MTKPTRSARKLGATQRAVLACVRSGDEPMTVAAIAAASGRSVSSVHAAATALAARGLVVTWTIGSGSQCVRYVGGPDAVPPEGAETQIRPKAGLVFDLRTAVPASEAPDPERLITSGQALVRTGADNHTLTAAIAAGRLTAYRAPAGPRAKRDALWLDAHELDRWSASRAHLARLGEWTQVTVPYEGTIRVPVWPMGAREGDVVEYQIGPSSVTVRLAARRTQASRPPSRRLPESVRAAAVKRVVDGGESQSAVAREIGVSHRAIGLWILETYGETLTELRATKAR